MAIAFRPAARQLILVAAAFAGGAAVGRLASASTEQESPYHVVDQMARVLVLVENDYVEPVERERLVQGAIKGMVAELDPHSSYLPAEEYSVFQADTEGRFGGIGVEVDFRDDYVTIIAPIEGSPAARAGIRPGDRILAIDSEPVRGKSADDLVKVMRGAPGSKVVLTIKRPGNDKLMYVKLTREIIEVASVASKLLENDIAYLRIKQFQSGTHAEMLEAIVELKNQAGGRFEGVVLDMRNNPGGLVHEAVGVADELLGSEVIYTTRHRGKVVDEVSGTPGGALRRGPMAVLVNEYSASAAELVAGALQDHHRATVIGAQTFGKGSVQTIVDLPGGDGLKLTTMRYYTPKGRAIQAQGIEPDVLVQAAYAKDTSFGVVRESDLENHLPAEGPPGSAPPEESADAGADAEAEDEDGGLPPTHLGVAREIPANPTGGPDFALSIAYQIVSGVLSRPKH